MHTKIDPTLRTSPAEESDSDAEGYLRLLHHASELQRVVAEKEAAYQQLYSFVQDLQLLLAQRNQALALASAASLAKSQLLANISHEFRTPLTSVIGFSEVLLRQTADPDSTDLLQRILLGGQRLGRLVDNLLTVARLQDRPAGGGEESIDLTAWLVQFVQPYIASAEKKGLTFHLDLPATSAPPLVINPVRLGRVLGELLDNAVKFTDQGEVSLKLEHAPVWGQGPCLTVCDTGIGMDENEQLSVFDSFSMADNSDSRRHSGAGLGLTIAKALAQTMGAELTCQSSKTGGTRLSLRLGETASQPSR